MLLIAHRGNINGPNIEEENSPNYIQKALDSGFYVEVDVWKTEEGEEDEVFLGHDEPQYKVNIKFLQNKKIICHGKTIDSLRYLLEKEIHCFFHDKDDCVLTSELYIWTYPGKELVKGSICVLPERIDRDVRKVLEYNCVGVCSDYVGELLI